MKRNKTVICPGCLRTDCRFPGAKGLCGNPMAQRAYLRRHPKMNRTK